MLKTVLIIIFVPITLIVMGITTILNFPTLLINPTTMGIIARHAAPFGVEIEWKDASSNSQSHGAFDETIELKFKELCVAMKPTIKKACFSDVELSTRYRFRGLIPDLATLGPITIMGGDIIIDPPEEKNGEKSEGIFPIPEIKLPSFMSKTNFYPVDISIDSLLIESENPLKIVAQAKLKPDDKGKIDKVSATVGMTINEKENFDLELSIISPSNFIAKDWNLKAKLSAELGKAGSAEMAAELDCGGEGEIKHDIKLTYSKEKMRGKVGLEGIIGKEIFKTKIDGDLDEASEFTPHISLMDCSFELLSKSKRENLGKLSFLCSVDVKLKKFKMPEDINPIYSQPRNIEATISLDADTSFFPDPDKKTNAQIDLKLKPQKNRLVDMGGNLNLGFEGILSDPPEKWNIKSDANFDLIIDNFAELIQALSESPWPVPAPFNTLNGSLEFSLEGRATSESGHAIIPAKLTTKLKSEKQRIFIDSDGKIVVGLHGAEAGKTSLNLNVNLEDIQLQLPDLAMAALPSLTPDGRIILNAREKAKKAAEKKKSERSTFDYNLKISTPENRPIRILSNITPTHVPIALDLNVNDKDISGKISIQKFPVTLFKREATIEYLDMTLRTPTETSGIDGRVEVPFPDLTAIVELVGTIEEPSITLASNPPMSQGDIISMLLYGEPMDALDSDNADSAGDMNAALANNAIAITSFFLLASTPIQSIGYNPDTGVFSARVKLAEKTTLKVGSSDNEREAKIRQRLGKGFSITTGWEKAEDDDDGSVSAYIEWSKRY